MRVYDELRTKGKWSWILIEQNYNYVAKVTLLGVRKSTLRMDFKVWLLFSAGFA